MTTSSSSHLCALDHRSNDGLDVWLLWDHDDDRVFVNVFDARTNESFTVDMPTGASPMRVFHHPFAYLERSGSAPSQVPVAP